MGPQEGRFEAAGGVLRIDLAALRANWAHVAERAAPASCAAVVKADAYGLGSARVTSALYAEGCRAFFVAHPGEALALGLLPLSRATSYVLNGLQPGAEATCADAPNDAPVLNGLDQIEAWAAQAASRERPLPAAVQVDSGMSRLGLSPGEVEVLADRPDLLGAIEVRLVMNHLACADELGQPSNGAQLAEFGRLRSLLPPAPASLAKSGGVLLGPPFGHDLVRPGLTLYGVSPTPGRGEGLRPVFGFDARVIQLRSVAAGTTVGYGGAWRAPRETRLATVAVGYADGWPRAMGADGAVFWSGVRLPVAGRVSMDSMTLDVSALTDGSLRLGAAIELICPHQDLGAIAALSGTIPYEIMTGLGRRFERVYAGTDEPGLPKKARSA